MAGPAAYVVLKALALKNRGENKDAYDLFYVLRHFESGVGEIASRMRRFAEDPNAREALEVLRENFSDIDGVGPMRVARFLTDGPDDDIQADAQGVVADLLERLDGGT